MTFQLINDENNPIDLNQKNTFTKTIDESGTAYFNFFINYVKKDNLRAKPGVYIFSYYVHCGSKKIRLLKNDNEFAGVENRVL